MASTRQLRNSKRRNQQPSSSTTTTIEPQTANTRGLSCLADEIYLEILSYLPPFPIPTKHGEADVRLYGHRRLVLDALSQTCRTLRRVFLRYRWQRIEVYDRMDLGRGPLRALGYKKSSATSTSKGYAVELIRQLEIVTIRDPSLAEFVTVLDILVVDYCAKNVLPELARCIALLPNLHTVHINFEISKLDSNVSHRSLLAETFTRYTYPNIRTACVSTNGAAFLCSCPGLKSLIPWKTDVYFPYYSKEFVSNCPSIETLGPLPFMFGMNLVSYTLDIVLILKNLCNISFELNKLPLDSDMQVLWKIPNLQIIAFVFHLVWPLGGHQVEEWKLRMEQILCKTGPSTEGKHKKLVVTIVYV